MHLFIKYIVKKNDIHIEHDVDEYLEEMISLSPDALELWKRNYAVLTHRLDGDSIPHIKGYEDVYPLDVLYNLPVLSKL